MDHRVALNSKGRAQSARSNSSSEPDAANTCTKHQLNVYEHA